MTLEAWHDFFVAQAGASAALAGLLFVALSINIGSIIKMPWLPPRAAATMVLLVGALIEALVALVPHASVTVLGIEELVVSGVVWGGIVRHAITGWNVPSNFVFVTRMSVVLAQCGSLPALAGAIALTAGVEAGIYGIAFAMLMSIAIAFFNSWVLLVEILR
jgi:modulator of FtsH protease